MSKEIKNEEQTIKNLVEDLEGYSVVECDILTTKATEIIRLKNTEASEEVRPSNVRGR